MDLRNPTDRISRALDGVDPDGPTELTEDSAGRELARLVEPALGAPGSAGRRAREVFAVAGLPGADDLAVVTKHLHTWLYLVTTASQSAEPKLARAAKHLEQDLRAIARELKSGEITRAQEQSLVQAAQMRYSARCAAARAPAEHRERTARVAASICTAIVKAAKVRRDAALGQGVRHVDIDGVEVGREMLMTASATATAAGAEITDDGDDGEQE